MKHLGFVEGKVYPERISIFFLLKNDLHVQLNSKQGEMMSF